LGSGIHPSIEGHFFAVADMSTPRLLKEGARMANVQDVAADIVERSGRLDTMKL
jgi:hypothetical protein